MREICRPQNSLNIHVYSHTYCAIMGHMVFSVLCALQKAVAYSLHFIVAPVPLPEYAVLDISL